MLIILEVRGDLSQLLGFLLCELHAVRFVVAWLHLLHCFGLRPNNLALDAPGCRVVIDILLIVIIRPLVHRR